MPNVEPLLGLTVTGPLIGLARYGWRMVTEES